MKKISLSATDIDHIARVVESEVPQSVRNADPVAYSNMVGAVVDTVTNRLATGKYKSVQAVANARDQFSAINGPVARPGVARAPKASTLTRETVNRHLAERAQGVPSLIGGATNYANPNFSDRKNRDGWISGMRKAGAVRLGVGKQEHYHGLAPGETAPPEYSLSIPSEVQKAYDPVGPQLPQSPSYPANLAYTKSLPDVGPVPTAAPAEPRAIAAARGLLSPSTPPAVQTAGLLGPVAAAPRTTAPVGLLGPTVSPVASPARAPAPIQTASLAPVKQATPVSPVTTPNQIAATAPRTTSTITGMDVTPGVADKGRRVTGPAIASGTLSPEQEANLDSRLGRSTPMVAQSVGLLGTTTALSPSAPKTGAVQAINGLLGTAPAAPIGTATALSPVQEATKALASVPSNATVAPAKVAETFGPVAPAGLLGGFDSEVAKRQATLNAGLAAQRTPALAAENPTAIPAAPAPALAAPRTVAAPPRVAAVEAAQPVMAAERARPSLPSMPSTTEATGLGMPDVPDAPGLGAQLASRIGNSLNQNKGRLAGGLLGSMALGPVGGLLGGYIGNRVQQGNTPQMSNQARAAIDDGYFDGFSHGVNKNAGLLGGLFGGGGLLGGMFGGSLGAPSIPGRPTGVANYSTGGGGPSMSSAARSAMDSGSFDGFSHDGGGNKNTSSKSGSSKGSKSSGGKKK